VTDQPADPIGRLEDVVAAVEDDLARRGRTNPTTPPSELAQDANGRYILLDAYAALAAAHAARIQLALALTTMPRDRAQRLAEQIRNGDIP
jgi:hypothetical protein